MGKGRLSDLGDPVRPTRRWWPTMSLVINLFFLSKVHAERL